MIKVQRCKLCSKMHKTISTKVQGKTSFETKLNYVNQTFDFLIFMWFLDFWHKKRKIDQNQKRKPKVCTNRQTNNQQHKQQASNQTPSPSIGSINAWTCCNAYARIPFFTHTSLAFGMISLWDWVRELGLSNLREKLSKQLVNAPIIFITFIILGSLFWSLDGTPAQFLLSFLGPRDLWGVALFFTLSFWQFGRVCPWSPQWWHT